MNIAPGPLLQPDIVAIVMQDAVFEPDLGHSPTLAGGQRLLQAPHVIGVHPLQPAKIVQTGFVQSQQPQTGEIPLHALLWAPAPEPCLQQGDGIRHQRQIKPGNCLPEGSLEHVHRAPRHRI